jgi:predicted permease
MSTFFNDIKYGIRQLIKSPGFTAVAIVSLALGIGVNTAIFSLLNGVFLRSLPVSDPHQLRTVNWGGHNVSYSNFSGTGTSGKGNMRMTSSFPYPLYCDFRDQVEGCSSVFAFKDLPGLTVIGPDGAATTEGLMVSGNFFEGYGAKALIGRIINPQDDEPSAEPVAVITYRWWDRHYGLDPNALGQTIMLNNINFTIIGVLPRYYCGPLIGDRSNIYVPMSAQPQLSKGYPLNSCNHWWLQIMARLKPKANETQVQAAMQGFLQQTLAAPDQRTHADQPVIVLEDGSRGPLMIRQRIAKPLYMLMVAVGLVLLIACANLAGLLLARGAVRQQELTVRAAMGAGRWRLIRQLLTESLILSLAGAAFGILLAMWIKAAIVGFISGLTDSFHMNVGTDMNVLLFTLALALLTSILFGLLPALRITRINLSSGLKDARTIGVTSLRLGKFLVATQVGLSVLLAVGAGLLLQTLINLYKVDVGFNTDKLLIFGLNPRQADYDDIERIQFYDNVRSAIVGVPGVRSVAFTSTSLLSGGLSCNGISIPGREQQPGQHMQADCLDVSETFFETMGISLLRGRTFNVTDTSSQSRVAIVNEKFANSFFPDEDPVGQSFRMGDRNFQMVGICGDTKYNRIQRAIEPTMYFAHRQTAPGAMFVEVRAAVDPMSLIPVIRKIVTDLDRTIPMMEISTQTQLLKQSILPERLFTILCSALAALGVGLSCVGLYGLLAFTVARRTGEIGVRMALGARPKDVAWPVVKNAFYLAAFGIAVGIPAALGITRIIRSILYDIKPYDPLTIVAAAVLLLLVAALAAWIPARRAAKTDPMEALRYE